MTMKATADSPFMVHLDETDLDAIETLKRKYQQGTNAAAARFAIAAVSQACPDADRIGAKERAKCKELGNGAAMTTLRIGKAARETLTMLTGAMEFDSDAECLRYCLRRTAEKAKGGA